MRKGDMRQEVRRCDVFLRHAAGAAVCLVLTMSFSSPALAQGTPSRQQTPFEGSWTGLCQDGKPFVFVTLRADGDTLTGTVSLGNATFGYVAGKAGTCTTVEPASRHHAMAARVTSVEGKRLTVEAVRGPRLEIVLTGADTARMRFLSVGLDDNFFEIRKTTA